MILLIGFKLQMYQLTAAAILAKAIDSRLWRWDEKRVPSNPITFITPQTPCQPAMHAGA